MFWAILFLATASVQAASNCDANKFVLCQNKFANALGIDSSYNWLDPIGLSVQIQNIYISGTTAKPNDKGIVSVCSAYNQFLDCLNDGAFTAFECFDPQFLITADASPIKAYQYAALMSMIQYQCGAGFYPAVDNWSCLQNAYSGQNTTLNTCMQTFTLNAQNDPNNACAYVATGMDCWSKAVKGCPDTIKYYGCESFRQYTVPRYAACNQKCYVPRG